jgi:hypothetical protein
MKQLFFTILLLAFFNCGENEKKSPIIASEVIIDAITLNFDDLNDIEKEDMIFTRCCCYPKNWNRGVNCIEKEDAFYVKAKININLLAELSESKIFTKDKLINSNPHSLYGKYHNRWQFLDEDENWICETSKFDGHNDFMLVRKGNIDEVIIGPLPEKPSKMIIEILDSKYYKGITPEFVIKN